MAASYYIGVDGGGSRCRVRIRDAAGALVGEATGGNANVFQDFEGGIATIVATARQAAVGLSAEGLANSVAGLGLAGVVSAQASDRVVAAPLPFKQTVVRNDAYIACLGAHGGADGGIVITGTGSAAYAIVDGRESDFGGWGFALGDDGSGAQVGRAVLRRASLASDEIIPATPLLSAVLEEFPTGRHAMTEWARTAFPRDYAAFAPRVFAAADQGDIEAAAILGEAAAGIALMLHRLKKLGAPRLSLVGGLAALFPPWLPDGLAAQLSPPIADATEGAIFMARRANQTATPGARP